MRVESLGGCYQILPHSFWVVLWSLHVGDTTRGKWQCESCYVSKVVRSRETPDIGFTILNHQSLFLNCWVSPKLRSYGRVFVPKKASTADINFLCLCGKQEACGSRKKQKSEANDTGTGKEQENTRENIHNKSKNLGGMSCEVPSRMKWKKVDFQVANLFIVYFQTQSNEILSISFPSSPFQGPLTTRSTCLILFTWLLNLIFSRLIIETEDWVSNFNSQWFPARQRQLVSIRDRLI